MALQPPFTFAIGDVVRLRRRHPCGADEWTIERLGADIGLTCRGCGRRVLLERPHVERRLEAVVSRARTEPA